MTRHRTPSTAPRHPARLSRAAFLRPLIDPCKRMVGGYKVAGEVFWEFVARRFGHRDVLSRTSDKNLGSRSSGLRLSGIAVLHIGRQP